MKRQPTGPTEQWLVRDGKRYKLTRRMYTISQMPLQAVIDHFVHNGIDLADVTCAHISASYHNWETEAERELRESYEAKSAERQEQWERETLARLLDKYGVPA